VEQDWVNLKAFLLLAAGRTRKSDRLLAIAAVVSAGLHALLMASGWVAIPKLPREIPPLEVRLARGLPEPKPAGLSTPRPKAPKPRRSPPPAAAPFPGVIAQGPVVSRDEPLADSPAGARETMPATGDDAETVADAKAVAAGPTAFDDPPAVPRAEEPALARSLPNKGTIVYTLTFGRDGFNVGRAVQSWEVGAGRYRLASDAETTGIVDIFRPQRLRWLSQGRITRQGLRPEAFLVSRTRRGQTEAAEARFNWAEGSLTYGFASDRASVALAAGTQDIMSFVYQLGLAPPAPGRFRLPITTGSRFEIYEIEVRSEENIETPLGTIRALPVKQERRPGAESIEIWLAADYRYLPVKIRYFDRDGNPAGEQLASEIRVSED
jgi:hypothetical protein